MKHPLLRAAFIAVVATLAAMVLSRALLRLDGALYDSAIRSRRAAPPADFAILGIDEQLMQGRHAYLAPRDRLAQLIEVVSEAKPKVIVLDVWLDSLLDPRQDALLRQALLHAKQLGVPVLLSDVDLEGQKSFTGVTAHGSVLPYFGDAAAGTGSSTFDTDLDGIVRSTAVASHLSPLPLLAAEAVRGASIPAVRSRIFKERLPLAWAGPPGTVTITSAQTYLEQPFLAALLANKNIFIGATYPRSYDLFYTPYNLDETKPRMYGVEVLANATATILDGARERPHDTPAALVETAAAVFVLAWLLAVLAYRGAIWGAAFALPGLAAAMALAIFSARQPVALLGNRFWPASPFLVGVVFAVAGGVAWRQWEQARELKLVRDAFGAYVGDEVLQKLGGRMPELGGEMRDISVLFCDIRGYSALAERMQDDPARLMSELNAHFEPLVAALKKRGAYADNYVGDLVMALFGAPISQGMFSKDVEASVLAAFDFVRLVEERNALRAAKGEPPIEVGIGLHCGPAVVGNLGTLGPQSKIHYTAIGDAVNIASRVESTTRKYNVALLVTEEVVTACGAQFQWQFVDETTVKGRVAPVRLYREQVQ